MAVCRRINNRASARRVRQKREEDLEKITGLVREVTGPPASLAYHIMLLLSGSAMLGQLTP